LPCCVNDANRIALESNLLVEGNAECVGDAFTATAIRWAHVNDLSVREHRRRRNQHTRPKKECGGEEARHAPPHRSLTKQRAWHRSALND
jgi:uncharacterized protein (UPF0218 family)